MPYAGYGVPVKRPWVVPTPPGSPYHRMARTAVHRWWRPWVGTLAILFGGFTSVIVLGIGAMIVAAVVTGEVPDGTGSGTTILGNEIADLGFNLAALAVFLPFAMLVPWWVQRRRPGTVSSVVGRLRWRWLLVCAGLALVFCAVSFGTSWVAGLVVDDPAPADEQWVGWGRFLAAAAVIVALVPFQASAEEYVFRGWLLQAVGACTLETRQGRVGRALSVVFRTPWPGIVIGSALFTSGHGYTGWGMLDVFVFGAIAGWMTVRSGGLEAAIALHVFNNLMAFLIPAAVGQLDIVQGAVPWQYVVADVVPMVLYAAAVMWLVKRLKIQTVVPDPTAPAAPEVPAAPGSPAPPAGPEAEPVGGVAAGQGAASGPGGPAAASAPGEPVDDVPDAPISPGTGGR
ncbi:lysostaphin resistance A-like protein [Spirillospora sp. CA-255316]